VSYPIFWPPVFFYTSFKLVLLGCFLQFLHFYFTVFYQFFLTFYIFISQHFICTLCKHFTRLFSNFYPLKSHFCLVILQHVVATFCFFTSVLNIEESRRVRRNFGREVTLKYLIWFRRDNFIIVFVIIFVFLLFYQSIILILLFLFYLTF